MCRISESLNFLTPCIACDYSHLASVNSVTCTSVAPIVAKLANSVVWKRKVNWMNVVTYEGGRSLLDEDHEILSPLRRFTVVCNEEGRPFLKKVSFHMIPSHHVLTDKGTRGEGRESCIRHNRASITMCHIVVWQHLQHWPRGWNRVVLRGSWLKRKSEILSIRVPIDWIYFVY
jgi:hypothetical protein